MIWFLLILSILIVLVITNRIKGGTYVSKALLYLDIFVASLFARDPGVTLSAYCGLALRHPKPGVMEALKRGLGHLLNILQPDHCNQAISGDIGRAHSALMILSTEGETR